MRRRQLHPYARPPLPKLKPHERPDFIHQQRTIDEMSVVIFYVATLGSVILVVAALVRFFSHGG